MCGSGLKLVFIASFPGLPRLQFLIVCSMQELQAIKNWSRGSIQATVSIENKTTQCWELVLG